MPFLLLEIALSFKVFMIAMFISASSMFNSYMLIPLYLFIDRFVAPEHVVSAPTVANCMQCFVPLKTTSHIIYCKLQQCYTVDAYCYLIDRYSKMI